MKRNKIPSGLSSAETPKRAARERTIELLEKLIGTIATLEAGIALACGAMAQSPAPPQSVARLPSAVDCCANPDQLVSRGCLSQQARWVKLGMKWTIQLGLAAPPGPNKISFEGLKREDLKVSGLSILDMKADAKRVAFALAAGASSRQASMQIPVLCNSQKITLKLVLDLSKLPYQNGSVPVKVAK